MPWKVSLAAFLLPYCAMAAEQPGARTHSVNDLVQTAIGNNRELLALRQRVLEARGLVKQAGARPAPSLQLGGASGSPLGSPGESEYSAGYSQPIETGGKRGKRVLVAEKGVLLAETELARQTLRLATEIKLRHLDAVTDQAKLAALARLTETYEESLRLIEVRVREGDAAALDGQLLRVEINRAEAQRRVLAGRILVALSDLRRLCGLGAGDALALGEPASLEAGRSYALAELQRQAIEQRPELRAAKLEEERAAAEVTLTEAQGRPDVTVSTQYSLRNESIGGVYGITPSGQQAPLRDRDNIVTLGVSVPLFTRRKSLGNIEAAAARATGSRTLRQHLEATIPLEVQAAWQHWEAAAQSLTVLDAGVLRQSEKNLDVIRQAYGLGQLRLLDVLNEQRRLIETQLSYVEAESDVRRGLIELERAVGGDLK